MNRKRARVLKAIAKSATDAVPLPLEPKIRETVRGILTEAAGKVWHRLNARERGEVSRNPGKLGTWLAIELVNPETKKARPVGAVADRVLARLRPASRSTEAKRKGWRDRRTSRRTPST